jgi:DNA polymerase
MENARLSPEQSVALLQQALAALRLQQDFGVDCGLGAEPMALAAPKRRLPPVLGALTAQGAEKPKPKPTAAQGPAYLRDDEVTAMVGQAVPVVPQTAHHAVDLSSISTLEGLRQAANTLPLSIRETATHLVFGAGNTQNPDIMLVGEAPGEEEDRTGQPFVGPAGQMLTNMLKAIGYEREQVYITNILFWRPPGNRTPKTEEVATCLPFLLRHIELVKPKTILLLGGVAGKALLGSDLSVARMRGRWWGHHSPGLEANLPVLVTFHPSYLLRTPAQKRESWADLRNLKKKINELQV